MGHLRALRRFARNFLASRLPLHRRVALAALNVSRRLFPRPSDCCGHAGEPGC